VSNEIYSRACKAVVKAGLAELARVKKLVEAKLKADEAYASSLKEAGAKLKGSSSSPTTTNDDSRGTFGAWFDLLGGWQDMLAETTEESAKIVRASAVESELGPTSADYKRESEEAQGTADRLLSGMHHAEGCVRLAYAHYAALADDHGARADRKVVAKKATAAPGKRKPDLWLAAAQYVSALGYLEEAYATGHAKLKAEFDKILELELARRTVVHRVLRLVASKQLDNFRGVEPAVRAHEAALERTTDRAKVERTVQATTVRLPALVASGPRSPPPPPPPLPGRRGCRVRQGARKVGPARQRGGRPGRSGGGL